MTLADSSSGSLSFARQLVARGGQTILFVLTLLLAGMLLSQLIEEKSNKVIESLAAAVPIDAIFLGKLFAMLAMSLVGITVWTAAGAAAIAYWIGGGLAALPDPAVGWPIFLALTFVYFATSYLLIGSVFLGIGGQASTVREVQTLSMPVTMAQVVIFGLASLAVGKPDGREAIGAAIFPLSSPYRDDRARRRAGRAVAACRRAWLAGAMGGADPQARGRHVPHQRAQVGAVAPLAVAQAAYGNRTPR